MEAPPGSQLSATKPKAQETAGPAGGGTVPGLLTPQSSVLMRVSGLPGKPEAIEAEQLQTESPRINQPQQYQAYGPRHSQRPSQGPSYTSYGHGSRTRHIGTFRILPTVASSLPFNTTCPYCGNYILTATSATPGLLNWLLCTTLFLIGCVLGCCLVPFCIEELMDVRHRCPVCRKQIYRYRRL